MAKSVPSRNSSPLPSSPPPTSPNTTLGAKYYKSIGLSGYDLWVLKISSSLAWGCPTPSILEPFFIANFGRQHMDIGVGTGYFPAAGLRAHEGTASHDDTSQSLTLVDLNDKSLEAAMKRIARPEITRCIVADALQPLPSEVQLFDSISIFYLLHCLPGPPKYKANIFKNLKAHLKDGAVLFGATVLGRDVQHNLFGQLLMFAYNWSGIFDNRLDGEEDFVGALRENFAQVEFKVVGRVLLFKAWKPI